MKLGRENSGENAGKKLPNPMPETPQDDVLIALDFQGNGVPGEVIAEAIAGGIAEMGNWSRKPVVHSEDGITVLGKATRRPGCSVAVVTATLDGPWTWTIRDRIRYVRVGVVSVTDAYWERPWPARMNPDGGIFAVRTHPTESTNAREELAKIVADGLASLFQ